MSMTMQIYRKEGNRMKGRWEITSEYVEGKHFYQVCRTLDRSRPMDGGNMEYAGEIYRSRSDALFLAEQLNRNN